MIPLESLKFNIRVEPVLLPGYALHVANSVWVLVLLTKLQLSETPMSSQSSLGFLYAFEKKLEFSSYEDQCCNLTRLLLLFEFTPSTDKVRLTPSKKDIFWYDSGFPADGVGIYCYIYLASEIYCATVGAWL